MSDGFYGYDDWKTTDPRDRYRDDMIPVEDQPGYDPDAENDRDEECE